MNKNQLPISQQLQIKEFIELQEYNVIFQQMIKFTYQRDPETVDQFWVLQHTPVFTQGNTGKKEHILQLSNIPIIQTDRGGQITYHGPKQLIIYCLVDIQRKKQQGLQNFNHHSLILAFETAVLDLCTQYKINAYSKKDAPGVYVIHQQKEKKLCSLGIKVTRKGSYHGLAINIDANLTPFQQINPCGYSGLEMINLQQLVNHQLDFKQISNQLLDSLTIKLNYKQIERILTL